MALDFRNMKKLTIGGIELKKLLINGVEVWKGFTNMIPESITSSKTPYVGNNGEDGYKTGYRLNSSGAEAAATGFNVTGFIPVKVKDVVYFKNINYVPGTNSSGSYLAVYNRSFTKIASVRSDQIADAAYLFKPYTTDANGNLTSVTLADGSRDYAYLRMSASQLGENSIITVNEPID